MRPAGGFGSGVVPVVEWAGSVRVKLDWNRAEAWVGEFVFIVERR